jgi:hypothetical protein
MIAIESLYSSSKAYVPVIILVNLLILTTILDSLL